MNSMLDKLAPGRNAKITFLVDVVLMLAVLAASMDWSTAFIGWTYVGLATAGVAAWGVAIAILRLYSPYTPRRVLDNVTLAVLAAMSMTVFLALLDALVLAPPPHLNALLFGGLLSLSVVATQFLVFRPLSRIEQPKDDILIVGTRSLGVATWRRFQEPGSSKNVLGFLQFPDDPALPESVDAPLFGSSDDLLAVLEQHPVAEVYLAERVMNQGPAMQKMVKVLEELGIPFAVPLHSLRYNRAQLLSSSKARDGYLHYLNTETKPLQWAIKRLLDIVLASIGLIVLSPLLLVVAAIIKLGDGGPVLFKQTRVGLHGSHFNFLKFRSMVINAEALKDELLKYNEQTGPAFKMAHDPRITKVGRFIRKYSIDELPQLINILRGDMTIVGPRPPVPREVALYKPWQRRRLSVRPGLTCYWQVGGRNEIGFDEWMLLDLRYVDHWTLAKDITLIAKTVPVVLLGKGAS